MKLFFRRKKKMRYLASRLGTIKKPKDMKGMICLQPFTNIDIQSNYELRLCSESWMPSGVGDFSKSSIMDVWNSDLVQKIRRSILDGTYEYCDWHQCPFYCNDSHYLYTMEQLEDERLSNYKPWIEYIKQGKTELEIAPANYNMAYDESCNLECPSCRNTRKVYSTGFEYEKRKHIQDKFLNEITEIGFNKVGRVNLSGSGEPFVSKVFRDFLFNFDGKKFPKLSVNIQSNGMYFNSENWDKMHKIHQNINEVIISIDASTQETYSQIRCKGNFVELLDNIKFLSTLRRQNKIRRFMLAFVVQRKNFREMIEAINIGKQMNVDLFIFNLLNNWGSWSFEEFESNAIWKEYNPDYDEFIEILKNPVFSDPILDLGNMIEYRTIALGKTYTEGVI
jgi:MoaA/NifB/PqqE/SkfB family radical SAM enzyme